MGGLGDHDIQRHEIPGFEDLTPIGSGGSSTVYRALDVGHQRTVALKVLSQPTIGPSGRSAFRREVDAIGRVGHHPYIVTVLGSGFTSRGQPYLVLPLCDGGTFGQLVDEHGPLTWSAAVDIGVKLASAVETVHRAGVVHRDIKPGNVFVGVTPKHPLLADFGISSTVAPGATNTTTAAVTFGYTAPEVLDDERPTPASDIYSLAMTVYRLIQGLHAYWAESPAAIVRKVVAESSRPQLSAGVPTQLAEVVADALAKEPADRPASALTLARRLQAVQVATGLPVTDVVVAGEPSQVNTGDGPSRPAPKATAIPSPAEPTSSQASDNAGSTAGIESSMLAALRERHQATPAKEPAPPSARTPAADAKSPKVKPAADGRVDIGAILAAALEVQPVPKAHERPNTTAGPSNIAAGPPGIDTRPPATIDLPTVVTPRKARHDINGLDENGTGNERRPPTWLLVTLTAILAAAVVGGAAVVLL